MLGFVWPRMRDRRTTLTALHWDDNGKPERAELERWNVEIERAAAQLERDRADLERREQAASRR